uniref:Membrane cofactor protein n=1 Tax=Sus scrofa TaxID=9823 RepID=A0A8D1DXA3_PIG
MTVACAPRKAPPERPERPPFSWCCVGILLLALVFPLPLFAFVVCPDPPKLKSAVLTSVLQQRYYPGDKIEYRCRPGYLPDPFETRKSSCEANGSWTPIDEACFRKSCPKPTIEHGEIYAPQRNFEFESEVHISCIEGYHLKGKGILTCQLIGQDVFWSDRMPQCERVYCGRPPQIKNGKHTNSYRNIFEYNELVTYTCNPSYGPDEYSLVGESKLFCSAPGKWSSAPPQCKVVKCERPELKHGVIVSGSREKFSYQAVVIFGCLQGFYLNGSNVVFCSGNNTWEPEIPKCIKGYRPTYPTKNPVDKYPGYPNPDFEIPSLDDFEDLDAGIIALMALTAIVAVAVVFTCLYRCLRSEKEVVKDKKGEEEEEQKEEKKEKEEETEKKEEKEKKKEKEKEKKEKKKKGKKEAGAVSATQMEKPTSPSVQKH